MTGPSLADLWGRKAGGLPSFERYSDALKSSGIIWNDKTLDRWLTGPQRMVPDNGMPFEGIKDAGAHADLLSFLKQATKPGAASERITKAQMPSLGGMMGSGRDPDLKKIKPAKQVKAIIYCHGTYHVVTGDGQTRTFSEGNLRFKTDSGNGGPEAGAPAIMPAGMMGDRVSMIFAPPDEIAKAIRSRC